MPGQQFFDGFGLAQVGRQDCRGETNFLLAVAPVPHARHFDRYSTDPGHHLAFGQMPVADQPRPAIVRFVRGISLQQNRKLGLNRLLNQPLRAGS